MSNGNSNLVIGPVLNKSATVNYTPSIAEIVIPSVCQVFDSIMHRIPTAMDLVVQGLDPLFIPETAALS